MLDESHDFGHHVTLIWQMFSNITNVKQFEETVNDYGKSYMIIFDNFLWCQDICITLTFWLYASKNEF